MRRFFAALMLVGLVGLVPAQSASAADTYGAIAYSPSTGRYGYSSGYGGQQQATIAALGYCASTGAPDCRIAVWYRNAWGALARGSNGAWGWGWGTSREGANYQALKGCNDHGGASCKIYLTAHS